MALVAVGATGLAMIGLSNFMCIAANALVSLASTAATAYFTHEALNCFDLYTKKIEQIKDPVLTQRYLKYLPDLSHTDAETVSEAKELVSTTTCPLITDFLHKIPLGFVQPTTNTNETATYLLSRIPCPGESGRVAMAVLNTRHQEYETCLRDPRRYVKSCTTYHYQEFETELAHLQAEVSQLHTVVKLNERYKEKADTHKFLFLEYATTAVISAATAVTGAAKSCFSRCSKAKTD